jgi:transcriptional regulator with GAF, ATPase, and Fis domain
VLIQGETGTGKELVAHALHQESPRANAPFIRVNCAAIPENLIESEFFGHEKGAFTGALNKHEGRFELAHGGTILLDEISEIPPSLQAKLLRVLQEREFERIGGTRTIKVDVRVIATTNRDLQECVRNKEFREDLYFRLNVVPIHVPPLRERGDDVRVLAEEFFKRYRRKHGCHSGTLSYDCLRRFAAYDWPGNIRELQNVVERTVILCTESCNTCTQGVGGESAEPGVASPPVAESRGVPMPAAPVPSVEGDDPITLAELEKRHILSTLEYCGGNRTKTAEQLDISIRTLRNKLNEYKTAGVVIPGSNDA